LDEHREGPTDFPIDPFAGDADGGFVRNQLVPQSKVGGVLFGGDADRPHREQITAGVDVGKRGVAGLDDLAVVACEVGVPHGFREAGRVGAGDVPVGRGHDDITVGRGVVGPVPEVSGEFSVDLALSDHETAGLAFEDPGAVDESGLRGAGRAADPQGDVGGPHVSARHHGHRRGERAEDHEEHHGKHARDTPPSAACQGSSWFEVVGSHDLAPRLAVSTDPRLIAAGSR
jgi:hypothetical protein